MITSHGWRTQAATTCPMVVAVMGSRSPAPRSSFLVSEQQESDEDKTDGPEPSGPAPFCARRFDFEPTRPSGRDAQHGDWQMRQLDEEFFFQVSERMRMRQQQRAAQCHQRRKNKRQPSRRDAPRAHTPFEKSESNDKHREQPMLGDLGVLQAFDRSDLAHRPDL